jgi:hypothetical protein
VGETGDKEQVAMETPCGKQERLIKALSFVSDASTAHLEGKVALIAEYNLVFTASCNWATSRIVKVARGRVVGGTVAAVLYHKFSKILAILNKYHCVGTIRSISSVQ